MDTNTRNVFIRFGVNDTSRPCPTNFCSECNIDLIAGLAAVAAYGSRYLYFLGFVGLPLLTAARPNKFTFTLVCGNW
jgi:hypothetical protein